MSRTRCCVISTARGCLTNLTDTSALRRALNEEVVEVVSDPKAADVILVNTCGYNQAAEDESLAFVESLRARFPGKRLIVGGCLPSINRAVVSAARERGDAAEWMTGSDWSRLNEQVKLPLLDSRELSSHSGELGPEDLRSRLWSARMAELFFSAFVSLRKRLGRRWQPLGHVLESFVMDGGAAVLPVARGCLGACTYCGIRKAKGALQSRPEAQILSELRKQLSAGSRRIHLVADDVACWGQDTGSDSAELLTALLRVPGDWHLVIHYFDPTWLLRLRGKLRNALADPRIICINIPLQSGSDRVLDAMGRRYSARRVFALLRRIRRGNPTLVLKTHLMVGFPGERWSDYFKTIAAVFRFDLIFPNLYTERPDTAARSLPGRISPAVRRIRMTGLQGAIAVRHLIVGVKSLAS